jgi:hypothetical protein
LDIEIDPVETQMWHFIFDPHLVEQIPEADLKPHPKSFYQRSESVQDFLNKTNIRQSLVKEALERSAIEIDQQR